MNEFKKFKWLVMALLLSFITISFSDKKIKSNKLPATIKIIFHNTVSGSKVILNDSIYSNPFNEKYTISKLRYYVTNVSFSGSNTFEEKNSYHLIDESVIESKSITFTVPAGNYKSLQFYLGVDSLHNVSGAQTDDLDPAKDMFWTWNSGYVMAKMEGNSPASKMVNNKYEFHIGGYAGPYNVIKKINLDLDAKEPKVFGADQATEISINADINSWWKGANDIKIADHATITTPGKLALAISDNYAKMFSLEAVTTIKEVPGN